MIGHVLRRSLCVRTEPEKAMAYIDEKNGMQLVGERGGVAWWKWPSSCTSMIVKVSDHRDSLRLRSVRALGEGVLEGED